jgi:4-amino-4-deoxy-L-arabinose transferase-like glycosyltransferase
MNQAKAGWMLKLKPRLPANTNNLFSRFSPLYLVQAQPYVVLFLSALAARVAVALLVRQPGYVDAYYYYQVAANWQSGHGLTETTVWNYQAGGLFDPAAPGNLEHPAFSYWTPLSSLLIILSFNLFGVSFWAASLPFMLMACALPPLAYRLGKILFGTEQRRYSWLMALVMLFPGRYFLFWNAPDNFALFALISLLTLILIHQGLYHNDRWLLLVGVLCGLAYLSRSDGILLTATLVICFGWRVWSARHKPETPGGLENLPRWKMLLAGLALALLVVSPWLARNLVQLGAILPANNAKVLFLRSYQDFFSYNLSLDSSYYLGWGWANIVESKLKGLGINAFLMLFQGLFLLGPLFLIGLWPVRKRRGFQPFLVYSGILFLVMALGFTEIGSHGTIFHSAGGLIPYQAGAALAGLEWLGRGKPRPRAASIMALVALGVTAYYVAAFGAPEWDSDYQAALRLESWFSQNATAKDVIMLGEPLSFHYATGRPAIAQASDGLAANLAAAKRFQARWLVLGPQRYGGLEELYQTKRTSGLGLELKFITTLPDGNQIYEIINQNKE